jgi:hypothetical protein
MGVKNLQEELEAERRKLKLAEATMERLGVREDAVPWLDDDDEDDDEGDEGTEDDEGGNEGEEGQGAGDVELAARCDESSESGTQAQATVVSQTSALQPGHST